MHLAYFDENKYSLASPFFYIGGYLLPEDKALSLEDSLMIIQEDFFGTVALKTDTEFHGKEMFHGKGAFKKRLLKDRVDLFDKIVDFVIHNELPVRMVCIDVNAHRYKYSRPEAEYGLGLMLILERFCEYLEKKGEIGAVFGDYEKDEISNAIIDFATFKSQGATPMYYGRSVGQLVDTLYFTHSHHSRFLQVSDVLVYLAGRYEKMPNKPNKWHDARLFDLWNDIKANTDTKIQYWP